MKLNAFREPVFHFRNELGWKVLVLDQPQDFFENEENALGHAL